MKSKVKSRAPIVLSAVVCPGIGQLMQRRWLAGAAYLILFFTSFISVMVTAGQIIISYYRLGFEFDTYNPEPVRLSNLIVAFSIALLIYLVNILDVFIAQQRLASKQTQDAFIQQNNLPL
jgi:hypothetical protein